MTEWKPIETAPKDGKKILVGCWDMNKWECEVSHWTSAVFTEYDSDEEQEYIGWVPMVGVNGPSHWMPLPEPPK